MASIFNVEKQLTFYGAYHSNKINVLIHIVCVPLIVWATAALISQAPTPDFFPDVHYVINHYMTFEFNWGLVLLVFYLVFYLVLEPVAAILYAPILTTLLLTSTSYIRSSPDAWHIVTGVEAACWIAQFYGHGVHEGRAPALLDNLVQALVLAPFFVHLELLFAAGYRPEFHKRLQNEIGKEITKVRRAKGDKRRAQEQASKGL